MIQIAEPELPALLTVKQLAELLQLSTRSIWRLRSTARLPKPVEIGGSVRWKSDEVRRWIDAGCPAIPASQKK